MICVNHMKLKHILGKIKYVSFKHILKVTHIMDNMQTKTVCLKYVTEYISTFCIKGCII